MSVAKVTVAMLAAQNTALLERLAAMEARLAAPTAAPKAPTPGTPEWAAKYAPALLRRDEQGRINYLCTVMQKEGPQAAFLLYTTSKELLAATPAKAVAKDVEEDDIPF